MNATAARTAVQGIADFLRKGGDLTEVEQQALAALDRDEQAAIERGVEALARPAVEGAETGGTVETFLLFPNVQRRAMNEESAMATDPIRADITDGARVSALFRGERITGRVTVANRRGGHYRLEEDGTMTCLELGTLDSVSIATGQDVLSPIGRVYRAVILREDFDNIQLLND